MSVFDYFIGTTQSMFASIAMITTILVICLAILFMNTDVPLGTRFGIVFFVLLISIFPIAISLFELTCIVTGGKNTKYNLCNYYAWFVTFIIFIYAFILILMVISSFFTYAKAQDKVRVTDNMKKMTSGEANQIAENIMKENFESAEEKKKIVPPKPVQAAQPAQPAPPVKPVKPASAQPMAYGGDSDTFMSL